MNAKYFIVMVNIIFMLIVSTIFGFAGLILSPTLKCFFSTFLSTFAIQIIIGKIWSEYVDLRMDQLIAYQEQTDSVKYVKLDCSYCGTKNDVEILLNTNNTFECSNCKNVNAVNISYSIVRTTSEVKPSDVIKDIFKKLDQ